MIEIGFKLFGPNYLNMGLLRPFWLGEALKTKLLRHQWHRELRLGIYDPSNISYSQVALAVEWKK